MVIRYGYAIDFSCNNFFKKYSGKIITEHHTNEVWETKLEAKNLKRKIKLLREINNSPKLLEKTAGIIGVTNEIRKIQLNKINIDKPSIVISNGIDIGSVSFTRFQPFDNKELKLIFVSSAFRSCHGLDLLIDSLHKYKGQYKIILLLIGDIYYEDYIEKINNFSHPKLGIAWQ